MRQLDGQVEGWRSSQLSHLFLLNIFPFKWIVQETSSLSHSCQITGSFRDLRMLGRLLFAKLENGAFSSMVRALSDLLRDFDFLFCGTGEPWGS